ncbi:hypothetical protein FEP34_05741 [Burkholderia multivorans]|nr:hypothetical protein [Burkholderia multivorans]
MRQRIAKRLPPDADKLVGLSLALFASGSRIEDRFWEAKLDALLAKWSCPCNSGHADTVRLMTPHYA